MRTCQSLLDKTPMSDIKEDIPPLHDNECEEVDCLSLEQHFIWNNSRVEAKEDCREGVTVDVEVPKAPRARRQNPQMRKTRTCHIHCHSAQAFENAEEEICVDEETPIC